MRGEGIFQSDAEPESKQHWPERCPEMFPEKGYLSDQCGTLMEVKREMMRKKYACLALAALLAFGGAAPVYAVEQEGRDGWKAEFTGKAIESNFTSSAFAEEISGLEPGDTIRIQIAVKNSSKKGTDL